MCFYGFLCMLVPWAACIFLCCFFLGPLVRSPLCALPCATLCAPRTHIARLLNASMARARACRARESAFSVSLPCLGLPCFSPIVFSPVFGSPVSLCFVPPVFFCRAWVPCSAACPRRSLWALRPDHFFDPPCAPCGLPSAAASWIPVRGHQIRDPGAPQSNAPFFECLFMFFVLFVVVFFAALAFHFLFFLRFVDETCVLKKNVCSVFVFLSVFCVFIRRFCECFFCVSVFWGFVVVFVDFFLDLCGFFFVPRGRTPRAGLGRADPAAPAAAQFGHLGRAHRKKHKTQKAKHKNKHRKREKNTKPQNPKHKTKHKTKTQKT